MSDVRVLAVVAVGCEAGAVVALHTGHPTVAVVAAALAVMAAAQVAAHLLVAAGRRWCDRQQAEAAATSVVFRAELIVDAEAERIAAEEAQP